MDIVVLKSEEDELLSDCDNSCVNDTLCVCITAFGMENAGQGMYNYGINKCVLCCRSDARHPSYPYRVVVDGYPISWVVGGVFIRFSVSDYETDGKRKITQVFTATEQDICPDTWVTKLYDTAIVKKTASATKWFIAVCETNGCKSLIHSYVDEHRAIGINESCMDLDTNTVVCKKCNEGLRFIYDTGGLVHYKGVTYSRCRFCYTIVTYKSATAIQICTTCLEEQHKELKIIERICLYCKNTVPINKRGGSQKLQVIQADGAVKDMFLCRHHKHKSLMCDKVYELNNIIDLL